jgi:hypothetical protein
MDPSFIQQRQRKTFQCNYAAGPTPHEYLSVAAGGIRGITDKFTGRPMWNISHQPLPLPGQPGSFYTFATSHYPVANIGGTVGLTMGVVPEGAAGTRFQTVLEDSMGWDIPTAEMAADVAMQVIARFLNGHFPQNGGWRMTGGLWRYAHQFDAPLGVPPPPPGPPEESAGDWPEDFFVNPRTARQFKKQLYGIEPNELLEMVAPALQEAWQLELTSEPVNGVAMPLYIGNNLAWPQQALGVMIACYSSSGGAFLWTCFADSNGWYFHEAKSALEYSLAMINSVLQTRFSGAVLETA